MGGQPAAATWMRLSLDGCALLDNRRLLVLVGLARNRAGCRPNHGPDRGADSRHDAPDGCSADGPGDRAANLFTMAVAYPGDLLLDGPVVGFLDRRLRHGLALDDPIAHDSTSLMAVG
jgi:hypothetical protein